MKERTKCVVAMALGCVVMTMVLVGGYRGIQFAARVAHAMDPAAQLEATINASAPLFRILGGR